MAKAYSYVRFSTPEQSKGDSHRRQIEASRAYAAEHGLELDDTLRFDDLGVSGYRGRNIKEGALGAFLAAVDDGKIEPGSFLLVENLDRLSRNTVMEAFGLFSSILSRGIVIVTMVDRKRYTQDSVNEQFGDLVFSLTTMYRAYEESALKGKRVGQAWQNKRRRAAEGHKLTKICPAWLRLDKGAGAFEVIPERAAVIREIFALSADGVGKARIATMLNERGTPTFGRSGGWHPSYVQKVLESEAVLGRYQPHKIQIGEDGRKRRIPDGEPIEDYFPAVVDRDLWLRVRAGRAERRIPGGQRGKAVSNLLTGIAVCGICGGPMNYANKGDGFAYLICSNQKRRVTSCGQRSWPYLMFEPRVLSYIREIDYARLVPFLRSESAQAVQALEKTRRGIVDDLGTVKAGIAKLVDAVEQTGISKALADRLAAQERRQEELEAQLADLDLQLQRRRQDMRNATGRLEQAKHALLYWFFSTVPEDQRYVQRARMVRLLRDAIECIRIWPGDEGLLAKIEIDFRDAGGLKRVVDVWPEWKGAVNWAIGPDGAVIEDQTVYHGDANPLIVRPAVEAS